MLAWPPASLLCSLQWKIVSLSAVTLFPDRSKWGGTQRQWAGGDRVRRDLGAGGTRAGPPEAVRRFWPVVPVGGVEGLWRGISQ